jgi:hypothetical protein
VNYESGRVIDIGIGYGQQKIYVPSIPVFLADLPGKRLPGSRRASHACEDTGKSSGLTNRFIKKRSSISPRKTIKKTEPGLYPFYTRWAIAFWYVLYYTPAQEESLFDVTNGFL